MIDLLIDWLINWLHSGKNYCRGLGITVASHIPVSGNKTFYFRFIRHSPGRSCMISQTRRKLFDAYLRIYEVRTSVILHSWPTAHPLYYTSNLLARGFSAVSWTCCRSARPRDCLYPNLTFQIIQNVTVFLVPILQ